jgi:hypothetical protein
MKIININNDIAIGNYFLSILTAIMICFHDDSRILSRVNNHVWGGSTNGITPITPMAGWFVMENQPING